MFLKPSGGRRLHSGMCPALVGEGYRVVLVHPPAFFFLYVIHARAPLFTMCENLAFFASGTFLRRCAWAGFRLWECITRGRRLAELWLRRGTF